MNNVIDIRDASVRMLACAANQRLVFVKAMPDERGRHPS